MTATTQVITSKKQPPRPRPRGRGTAVLATVSDGLFEGRTRRRAVDWTTAVQNLDRAARIGNRAAA